MLVGVVSGTYSTVFIASAIAITLSQRNQPLAASPTAAARQEAKARPKRKTRGAKAS
jgi:hypothetical protein